MNGKVTVTATDQGHVIIPSENSPEYGYVRVEQIVPEFNGRFMNKRTRSTIIAGKLEELKELNYKQGQELPGKIVVKESFDPTNPENGEKDLKKAGDTNIVCRVGDQPIYRTTFYTENLDDKDELIKHDNTEEITKAQRIRKLAGLGTGATL
jgi:hypothetical protein